MRVFVSMTSISSRLETLRLTIESLLQQSYTPDKIYINLSRDAYLFDEGVSVLPDWLRGIEGDLVSIHWCDNIGPYRKLIPIISELEPDDNIVICDDDVEYHKEWLNSLLLTSKAHEDDIICIQARKVPSFFIWRPSYLFWPLTKTGGKKSRVLPIGVGGVLYKKRFFNIEALLDSGFKETAPTTDDLWFWQTAMNVDSVYVVNSPYPLFRVFDVGPNSLTSVNVTSSGNLTTHIQRKVINIYGLLGGKIVTNDHSFARIKNYLIKYDNRKFK